MTRSSRISRRSPWIRSLTWRFRPLTGIRSPWSRSGHWKTTSWISTTCPFEETKKIEKKAMSDSADPVSLRVKRLEGNQDIAMPSYETEGASGLDLRAAVDGELTLHPGD